MKNSFKQRLIINISIIFLLLGTSYCADVVQTQISSGWVFKQTGTSQWHPANVPSTVHLDLLDNQLIEDPYYRDNILKLYWIQTADWEYQSDFQVDSKILDKKVVQIVFQGLDTHATVTLNGQVILQADNMHRTWVVDIKAHALKGSNTLHVQFDSAAQHDIEAAQKLQPIVLPANYSHSRKAAYQYGWDWGPRLVTAGIWKPVIIRGYDYGRIDSILVRNSQITQRNPEQVQMTVDVDLEVAKLGRYGVTVSYFLIGSMGPVTSYSQQFFIFKWFFHRLRQRTVTIQFTIKNPSLWWTRQLGNPSLYQIKVSLNRQGELLDEKEVNYGIRTLQWVQTKDDDNKGGSSFKANLNGIDVYMKGGNYIPPDMFMPRALKNPSVYNQTVQDAIDANYNMLRLWGGGQFEYDIFYDTCDKSGILIWHDLMFACALYPGQKSMLDNIAAEMTDNVKRLRNHPSIAMWNGNNEVWIGWQQWGWQKLYNDKQKQTVYGWYTSIFQKTIPNVLKKEDPDRFYWPTSPSVSYSTPSFNQGDIHYWGVWAGQSDIEEYNYYVGRFNSQYGMQGMIPMTSIKKFTTAEDWNIDSIVSQLHERHPVGWPTLKHYISTYFRAPTSFQKYVYATIVLQGYAVQTAIEALRRAQPYNMGSLYWQINDVWPVFSWASVDFYGQWKMLHYRAQELYRDLMISIQQDQNSTSNYIVSIVNDYLEVETGTLLTDIVQLDGTVLCSDKRKLSIASNSKSISYIKFDSKCAQFDLQDTYVRSKLNADSTAQLIENYYFFVRPLRFQLVDPKIQLSFDSSSQSIKVSASQFAFAVFVYVDDDYLFQLDNNYFHIQAGNSVTAKVIRAQNLDDPNLGSQLQVMSLYDSYQS